MKPSSKALLALVLATTLLGVTICPADCFSPDPPVAKGCHDPAPRSPAETGACCTLAAASPAATPELSPPVLLLAFAPAPVAGDGAGPGELRQRPRSRQHSPPPFLRYLSLRI